MYHDVKRRLPYYWRDIKDALTYRVFARTVQIYFVNVLPAIAFTLDMYRCTGQFFGINEALFSSALAAMVFSLLACQPLTHRRCHRSDRIVQLHHLRRYHNVRALHIPNPAFTAWFRIWAAIFHWIVAFGNFSDYMAYVTDFSSETFGMYVGIIYCIRGVEELVYLFEPTTLAGGYLSIVIAILYFGSVYGLEKLGSSTLWQPGFRGFLDDYAFVFPTFFWVGSYYFSGRLVDTKIYRIPVGGAFSPTRPRNWVIDFWNLEVKWVFVAVPFGFLMMLLSYFEHNVSSLTAQACQFPLKKPAGFHWDFFLLGFTCFVGGILGLPLPNSLVSQAPVHTDPLTIYQIKLEAIETKDGGEIRQPVVGAAAGTITGPLLTVVHIMPAAVFAGIFSVFGVSHAWS
ncbi:hypothetical protein EK21DRAFT_100311 [Setomelanomma holmii]|uniref:Bicarbonate transporter-like transmembrane domain-containing protein n=1 Tax=Setomelanomma holmii TaxID=210430 RepID=A0A9P4LM79_9PLEO|nr:hypothetical protein EK21DRAFT_100311 [Setomelanomma holmii]